MSEALPGLLQPPPPPARTRDSASVILLREGPGGRETFWVLRGSHLRFSAGFYAFPGGAVDADDAGIPVAGAAPAEARLIVAAAREAFEETGVLLARGRFDPQRLGELRRALLDEKRSFAQVLGELGASLDAALFTPAGRWITPPFAPIRFDARFFLAQLPEGQAGEVWPGELAAGGWITPRDALAHWAEGKALLHPPIHNALTALADHPILEKAVARLQAPPGLVDFVAERIEFQQGLFVYPLQTPTLPPAFHTACYLVGNGEMVVIDPGSPEPAEQERLLSFCRKLSAEGRHLRAVVLTHHHGDHVGGAASLSRALGIPLWAHRRTADRVPGVTRLLEDGEVIELDGRPPLSLRAVHTPGHADGHLCFFEPRSRALICGDMISSVSTIVIDPPEGDMGLYLASLDKLVALEPTALHPAHGGTIVDGPRKLAEYKAHRLRREQLVLVALEGGPQPLSEIVRRAYQDTPPLLWPLAERSALATLIKLEREKRARAQGERYARLGSEPP
jgi:glyoxylase-like metal-dependent hydrolase (beta-lactamase superfamily II)/8-oxo-dGTP pyrophosphatase MutT (NUDIX family)